MWDVKRGRGSGWKEGVAGLGNGRPLRKRCLKFRRRTKENLHHRHAVKGLRLDMLDVVHQRCEAALCYRGDSIRHVLGGKSLIIPDNTDDRNINVRENIRRSAKKDNWSKDQDQECHHDEGVWPA